MTENRTFLPKPVCRYGYPANQLNDILGPSHESFDRWMNGQTMSICDGREYDHEKQEYHATGCGPHGVIVYPWDLNRYMQGRSVID